MTTGFMLPKWLERLLGVDLAEAGEGTQWSISAAWSVPPWLTLLLAAAAIALVVFFYLRESKVVGMAYAGLLAALRLSALGVVCFMLADVMLTRERTGLPYAVVLVDVSGSMSHIDQYLDSAQREAILARLKAAQLDEPSRVNLARMLLLENDAALLKALDRRYKLKAYLFDRTARAQSANLDDLQKALRDEAQATGETTQLGQAVRTVLNDLRGSPPSAVIVLSDGINTSGEPLADAAEYARRKKVPLFTVALGSEEPLRNLKLSDPLVDEVVFVDDVVFFEFQLTGNGLGGKRVQVTLREKDKPAALTDVQVTVDPSGKPQKVRLPYRPPRSQWEQRVQAGQDYVEYRFVIEAEKLPEEGDRTADNALPPQTVKVSQRKIRVLLATSEPSHEFRFLKHLLEREPSIEVRTVLQSADPEYAGIDKSALATFPVRRDELNEFDLLILGDIEPHTPTFSTSVMNNVVSFVKEQGRSVIFIAGPRYMPREFRDSPLAGLFPFETGSVVAPPPDIDLADGFTVQPTDLGLSSPHMQLGDAPGQTETIWRNLPELYFLVEVPHLRPAARVLAEHPTRTGPTGRKLPVFIEHSLGGKVLFHCTDEVYRWRYRVGDVFLSRYWVQTIRYLCRSKLLGDQRHAELSTDRKNYVRGEPVRLRARFLDERLAPDADDGVTVMLERQGHAPQKLKLQRHATSRGVFEGALNNAPDGNYHAWIATPTMLGTAGQADFTIEPPPGEMQKLEVDTAELKRAATTTGGRFYTLAEASRLVNDLPEGRQVVIETLDPFVLWNWFPFPLLVVLLLVAEWVLRKRKGLV
jgi:hypothetical protein